MNNYLWKAFRFWFGLKQNAAESYRKLVKVMVVTLCQKQKILNKKQFLAVLKSVEKFQQSIQRMSNEVNGKRMEK